MSLQRPFVRPLLIWFYAGLLQVLASPMFFLLSPFVGRRRAFWLLAPLYMRHVAWLFGIRPEMEGWESLPPEIRSGQQPAIFIANHASLLDPALLIATLPCGPLFMAKKELGRVPVMGWIMKLAGFILIDRRNPSRAAASLHLAARRVQAGQSIVAFPEGTRTRTGDLLPFKKGIFLLARRAQVPVVPLGIHGGRDILPADSWRVARGYYRIRVGKVAFPSDYLNSEAMKQAMEQEVLKLIFEQQ